MKFLLFLFLILFTLNGYAQDYLLDKYETTYFHHRKEYTWNELDDVYMESEKALNIYNNAKSDLNRAENYAVVGALTLGIGITTFWLGTNGHKLIYGDLILVTGSLIEVGALIYLLRGKGKLIKARRVFNFEMMERYGYESGVFIGLGGTGNGVGVVLKF